MIRTLPHILARVFGTPLLVHPARLDGLLAGLSAALIQRGSLQADLPSTPANERPPRGYRLDRGVAVVPAHGVLVRRAGQIDADSTPLQSYEKLGRVLRTAAADRRARAILLDVDSPGGEAGGVFDLAAEIGTVARMKPLWAIANEDLLSAAYVLASPAQRIWTTQTGAVGSLGVVALHTNQARWDAKRGFKLTYLYKGARKIDANPHMALGDEARVHIQAEIDRLYDTLIATVAAHRGLEPERLRATEAGVLFGGNALAAGLADRQGTLDEAISNLAEYSAPASGRRSMIEQTDTGPVVESESATSAPISPAASSPAAAEAPGAPPVAPLGGDNVVQFADLHAAIAATRESAGDIAALCVLAGYPDMAAEQIRAGASVEAVRRLLQSRKAADAAARQVEAIDVGAIKPGRNLAVELEEAARQRFAAQRGTTRAP